MIMNDMLQRNNQKSGKIKQQQVIIKHGQDN